MFLRCCQLFSLRAKNYVERAQPAHKTPDEATDPLCLLSSNGRLEKGIERLVVSLLHEALLLRHRPERFFQPSQLATL